MRNLVTVLAVAAGFAAVPAQAQWRQIDGGMRHDASGLVCPGEAGGFALKTQVASATGFSCRYTLSCAADAACDGKAGFAAVTWNPAMDFDTQFRSLAAQQKVAVVDEPGPDWAGPSTLFARGDDGFGAWWRVQSHGQPLNIGLFYNAAAEPDAKALVEAVTRANP